MGKFIEMIVSFILCLYTFFISWSGVFTLGRWIPIHVALLTTAVMLYIPKFMSSYKIPKKLYQAEDIFVCIGLITIMISGIFYPNEKTANYLMAYFYVFAIGYFALKLLLYKNVSAEKLLTVNTVGVLFVAAFAVMELTLNQFWGFDIQQYMPRIKPATATYNVIFRRSYGLATEPTILGYYFNTLGPLALWQLWRLKYISSILKYCLSGLLVLGWVFTFSPACIVFMILSILIVFGIRFMDAMMAKRKGLSKKSHHRHIDSGCIISEPLLKSHSKATAKNVYSRKLLVVSALVIVASFFVIKHADVVVNNVRPMYLKATLQGSGPSTQMRTRLWREALTGISERPFFGKGIGSLSSEKRGSCNNWYLFLSLESGVVATTSFLLFLLFSFGRILKSTLPAKYWFMVGLMAAVLHFNVISTIHHPFLWFLIAIFNVIETKKQAMV